MVVRLNKFLFRKCPDNICDIIRFREITAANNITNLIHLLLSERFSTLGYWIQRLKVELLSKYVPKQLVHFSIDSFPYPFSVNCLPIQNHSVFRSIDLKARVAEDKTERDEPLPDSLLDGSNTPRWYQDLQGGPASGWASLHCLPRCITGVGQESRETDLNWYRRDF